MGVIVFAMLCGYQPFTGDSEMELHENIKNGLFALDHLCWGDIGSLAKDFSSCLLKVEARQVRREAGAGSKGESERWLELPAAAQRLTAAQALERSRITILTLF